jgi:hypothetical protein
MGQDAPDLQRLSERESDQNKAGKGQKLGAMEACSWHVSPAEPRCQRHAANDQHGQDIQNEAAWRQAGVKIFCESHNVRGWF